MGRKSIRVKKAHPQTPAVPVDYTLESITGAVSVSTLSAALPLGDWQLDAGHFIPAKMPMVVTHPRPDAETNSRERHRNAYPNLEYRIPIAVQGGAYPFYYEIVTQPGGGQPDASIGQQMGAADYGILSWTPTSEGGPYTIMVRVYDQEYPTTSPVDVTFTVTVSTSAFVFVSSAVETSGDGSIGSPFKYVGDTNNSANSNKLVYIRGGTNYTWNPAGGGQTNVQITDTLGAKTYLGYPGESVVLSLEVGKFWCRTPGTFFSGMTIRTSPITVGVASRMWLVSDGAHRLTIFENAITNMRGIGTDEFPAETWGSTSNQGVIHSSTPGISNPPYVYFTLWGNTLSDIRVRGFGSLYAVRYGVCEDNQMVEPLYVKSTGDTSNILDLKESNGDWSIRRNVGVIDGLTQDLLQNRMGLKSTPTRDLKTEYCYNLLRLSANNSSIIYSGADTEAKEANHSVWIYRNTLLNSRASGADNGPPFTVYFENNVYLTDGTLYDVDGVYETIVVGTGDLADLTGTTGDIATVLDAEYKLRNVSGGTQYRDLYLGTRGHEIA